ncbi:protein anachronism isoform X2 [Bradysia coprophila]|uniref:protein anachronism isoform X2 n=1 Tax=Bradysia coprophila TaxID=38358 RepID=UPI00187DC4DC|nr:protein anachronism isoform X2 [Bradysia coprophila]
MFDLIKIVLSATVAFFLFNSFAQGAPSINDGQTVHNDEIVSTVIDMNNFNTSAIFNQFNISREDVERRLNRINESDADEDDGSRRQFIEIFKQKIMSSVDRQNNGTHDLADDQSSNTIHNVAFYPVCSMNNETSWLADNTAKLYFSTHLLAKLEPNTYLHNAKLRLKQKDPDHSERTTPTRCDEPVEIIRVTVSVFVKRSIKGEMKSKKRVCTSFTTPKNNNGWIEIDVRQVIRHWEKAYRANTSSRGGQTINDPVLTIDVEDQDQNPLKAGLYFEPTDCQASTAAIPWSFYRDDDIRNSDGHSSLPNNPRLDIRYSRSETNEPIPIHRHTHSHHHRHQHRKNLNRFDNSNYQRIGADGFVADEPERRNFQYVSEQQLQHRQRHSQNREQHRHHNNDELAE